MNSLVLAWILFGAAIFVAFYSGRFWTYQYGFLLWLGGLALATGFFLAAHYFSGWQVLLNPIAGIAVLTLLAVFSDPELYRSGTQKLVVKIVNPLLAKLNFPRLPKPN